MEVGATTNTSGSGLFTNPIELIILLLIISGLFLSIIYFSRYIGAWFRSRDREKYSLDSVLLQVTVPRDNEIKIDAAEQLFAALYAIKKPTGRFNLKANHMIKGVSIDLLGK